LLCELKKALHLTAGQNYRFTKKNRFTKKEWSWLHSHSDQLPETTINAYLLLYGFVWLLL